uniref:Triokinase/FMN cyclase n=1 Tax=Graphocephala atropunctata TaxID=36148 RepID=A0A1B6KGB5_9HEMI
MMITREQPETTVGNTNGEKSNKSESLDDLRITSLDKMNKQVSFLKRVPLFDDSSDKTDVVDSYLEGVALQNRGLVVIKDFNIILRKDHEAMTEKVKILTGGATGLEPLHSGFIGPGMSTGAVFGDDTSSPSYMNILVALRVLGREHTRGVLVIVMNNLADRLNFGLACQKAAHEGINCLCLTVGDDCAGIDSGPVGKRGSCGIVFLLKIAGAMSEKEKSLYEMYWLMKSLNAGFLRTVNITIDSEVLTVGTGLKGEPGSYGTQTNSLSQATQEAITLLFSPDSPSSLFIKKEENVAIIINNFGKLSDFHFCLIVRKVLNFLHSMSVNIVRVYIGRFLSTSVSQGFSISILKLNDRLLNWLDFPVSVASWSNRGNTVAGISSGQDWFSYYNSFTLTEAALCSLEDPLKEKNLGAKFTFDQVVLSVRILVTVVDHVVDAEEHLNDLDTDLDYGTTIKKFMLGLKNEMDMKILNIVSPYGLLNDLADIAAASMGGVSGAVFNVLFASAAQAFLESSKQTAVDWEKWISACRMAREALMSYTHVRPGDRTILDTLHPFVEAFTEPTLSGLKVAVTAARAGAEKTATMNPQLATQPDPGAWILAEVLLVILSQLEIAFTNDKGSLESTSESEQ